jgi:hypothetical protein
VGGAGLRSWLPMSRSRRALVLTLVAIASLASAAAAQAAVVTIGSTATPTTGGENTQPVMFLNVGLGAAPGLVTSPTDGTIIRWRVAGFEGPWRLRVLTPNGGPSYTGTGSGGVESVPDRGPHTYATALPVRAGQTIAIESTGQAWFGAVSSPGAVFAAFVPPLPDGATGNAAVFENTSFTFSADVLPPPKVATIVPASGPVSGGTTVAIGGSDFTEVRGVAFGGVPAAFTVLGEGLITAVAPPSATRASVPVTVTTAAGTATSPQLFTYEGCAVPKLRGRKLKAAKRIIRNEGCLVGKVRKRKGVMAKTGKVVRQRPKPGQVLPPGTKVNVKLG